MEDVRCVFVCELVYQEAVRCVVCEVCVNWHTWRLRGVSCVRCVCELAYLEAERCVMCEVCV